MRTEPAPDYFDAAYAKATEATHGIRSTRRYPAGGYPDVWLIGTYDAMLDYLFDRLEGDAQYTVVELTDDDRVAWLETAESCEYERRMHLSHPELF